MLHLSQHLPWTLWFSHKSSFCTGAREPTPLIMFFLLFTVFFTMTWLTLVTLTKIEYQNSFLVPWIILEDSTLREKQLFLMPQYFSNISLQIFMWSKALTFNYGPTKFKPWSKISLSLDRAFTQTFLALYQFQSFSKKGIFLELTVDVW